MKKKILFFPFELLSHYSRSLMLANSIKDQYEVQILYSEKYKSLIDEFNIPTFNCLSLDAEMILEHTKKFSFDWIQQEYIEKIFISQVQIVKQLKADIIIGDAMWTLKMVAEHSGVFYCSVVNAYMSTHYKEKRGLPSWHHANIYLNVFPKGLSTKLVRIGEEFYFRKHHYTFKKIRNKYALKPKVKLIEELEGDITLICDHPDVFPLKKLPNDFYNIGPLYFENDKAEAIEVNVKKGKTILVCMGSSGNFEKIEFFKDPVFNDYFFILISQNEYQEFGENFITKKFLNFNKILPFIDLMICHGGNGTLYYALKHKVPVLAFTSHFEQQWNMNQIIKFNLGAILKENDSILEIKKKIEYWVRQKGSLNTTFKINLNATVKKFREILIHNTK